MTNNAPGGIGQAGVLPMIGLVMPFLVPFVKPIVQVMEKYNIMPKATSDLMKAIDTIRTEAMTLTTTARSGAEDSKCPLSKSLAPTVGSFLSRIINHKDTETNEPLSNPAVSASLLLSRRRQEQQ